MVQKKAPDKHGSPAESSKRSHAMSEKRLYSHHHHHQEGGGAGAGDLRKMLKKSRSIKVLEESLDSPQGTQLVHLGKPQPQKKKKKRPQPPAVLPNYMKSTSSSDAKKEQAQVSSTSTHSMPAANKNRAPNHTKASDRLKKPSSGGGGSGPKPAKLLVKKPSLRPVRPSMKKILGILPCPKINAGRATCSSTIKDTKFPDHLDLNPGGTEAEGTSVFKVCPFTYCSLNGHRHPPLPPLKCFLSARRMLLKTQKSMKLKGLSSFKKTGAAEEEGEVEVGAGQAGLPGVSSLVEDLGDNFFVEIYAKCQKDDASVSAGGSDDGAQPVSAAIDAMSVAGDGGKNWEAKIGEGRGSPVDDSVSQVASEDNFDQISEFSPSEMEVLVNFLEYVECDAEDLPCPTHGHADGGCGCCSRTGSSRFGKGLAEDDEPVSEADDLDWEEDSCLYINFDEIEYSDIAEEESCDRLCFAINEASLDAISCLPQKGGVEGAEESEPAGGGVPEFNFSNEASDEVIEQSGEFDLNYVWEKISKAVQVGGDEEFERGDEVGVGTASDETTETTTSALEDPMGEKNQGVEEVIFEGQEAEAVVLEAEDLIGVSNIESMDNSFNGDDMDGENSNAQVKEAEICEASPDDGTEEGFSIDNLFSEVSPDAVDRGEIQEKVEEDQNEASNIKMGTWKSEEEDGSEVFDEMPVQGDDNCDASELCTGTTTTSTECPQDDAEFLEEESADTSDNSKARAMVRRKKPTEDEEELRPFNPRAPNFLPVEPDPEAEKVDLRHQLMDERKNAEEWMVDYALRRAVDKLAPSRTRKVALLVEAFETVTPMPPYGSSLGHSAVGFAHARPIQACS